jgi:hypothetical protein
MAIKKAQTVNSGTRSTNTHRPHTCACSACHGVHNGFPAGYLYLDGDFVIAHRKEIERFLIGEAEQASKENPGERIMAWEKGDDDRLIIATTTDHLALLLGHALEKTFNGDTRYGFSQESKVARVWWHRD